MPGCMSALGFSLSSHFNAGVKLYDSMGGRCKVSAKSTRLMTLLLSLQGASVENNDALHGVVENRSAEAEYLKW